jgi:effector-binding domain-containing protein
VKPQDVVIKETEPLRVAEARAVAAGLDPRHIGPVFVALSPRLIDHLGQAGARPGILVHYYEAPAEDGSVGVHVGYDIGEQPVPAAEGVEIVDLPVVQVASIVHLGGMEHIVPVYEALIRWIEGSGYRLAGYSRELYHEMGEDGPRVTELQMPVARL